MSSVQSPIEKLSKRQLEKLQECISRVASFGAFEVLWNDILTRDQQMSLEDDINRAYHKFGGTIGVWMKIRGFDDRNIAAIDVGREMNLTDENVARKLNEVLGGNPSISSTLRPVWNRIDGELLFHGTVIREIRTFRNPSNIELIVDTFESKGWPEQIETPADLDNEKVRDTVRTLNKGLKDISFHKKDGGKNFYGEKNNLSFFKKHLQSPPQLPSNSHPNINNN